MRLHFQYILIILFLVSCSKDPQEINIYDIPDEFRIDLHQAPSEVGTQPSIKVTTIKTQPCENDEINAILSKDNNALFVEIRDIIKSQNCIPNPHKINSLPLLLI